MTSHERAVEVDTHLAAIWQERGEQADVVRRSLDSLHSYDGQRRDTWARQQPWPKSDPETEASIRTKLTDGTWLKEYDGRQVLIYPGSDVERIVARIDSARDRINALYDEEAPLVEEYERDPWPRFFLVTNSNGHIHRNMACQTTFPTTQWAWLPDLSGLTEEDAVKAHGPRLCSVCYPSAPVEWTLGLPKAPQCEGSGKPPAPGRERYASQPCSVCGRFYPVSRNTGVVRAHKPAAQ